MNKYATPSIMVLIGVGLLGLTGYMFKSALDSHSYGIGLAWFPLFFGVILLFIGVFWLRLLMNTRNMPDQSKMSLCPKCGTPIDSQTSHQGSCPKCGSPASETEQK